ncbi:hypothetical protein [Flavobacterium rhizosphaerae]|uniref:DUF1735 domain-containing protein n=1 Tax=Flavobacterium rhizosphaerae TaxID=3163298 RepID=A0ABW8YTD7_9FLAO
MKNIFLKFALIAFIGSAITACDRDELTLSGDAPEMYMFADSESDAPINEEQNVVYVEFGVTTKSNQDRTIAISVDPTSTITPSQYSIPSTVTIPAGSFVGEIPITFNVDQFSEGQDFDMILTVDEASYPILDDKNFHTLTVFKYCGTESLAGVHDYVQYNMFKGAGGGTGSGTPVEGTIEGQLAWTETSTGVYSISDLSWGHYDFVWDDAPATDGTAAIQWTCSGLALAGTAKDQYGLTYTYNFISVDGPVLTFVWTNNYGDQGTVEVTRAGGEDWPDGLL